MSSSWLVELLKTGGCWRLAAPRQSRTHRGPTPLSAEHFQLNFSRILYEYSCTVTTAGLYSTYNLAVRWSPRTEKLIAKRRGEYGCRRESLDVEMMVPATTPPSHVEIVTA
jgi:hypothetical protein